MTRLELGQDAKDDLANIYLQGFEMFGLAQADRYIDSLLETLDLIANFPEIARLRRDIEPPVHAYPYRSHVILYDVGKDGDVLIVRIRHGLEDWQGQSGADLP